MNDLQKFNFNDMAIRAITDDHGEPWFVAKDVCDVLDLKNYQTSLGSIDDDEKTTIHIMDSGQMRKKTIINESGLYSLILRSRKPEAKAFKKWVTSQVLPSIRKSGRYDAADDTEYFARAVLTADKILKAKDEQIKQLQPKAAFYDQVAGLDDVVSLNDAAKMIGKGRNLLMTELRNSKVLFRNRRGETVPYQQYINNGYFVVKESPYKHENELCIRLSTHVTQKGLQLLQERYSL